MIRLRMTGGAARRPKSDNPHIKPSESLEPPLIVRIIMASALYVHYIAKARTKLVIPTLTPPSVG